MIKRNSSDSKGLGHTTYILKATIWNPEVIVLVSSVEFGIKLKDSRDNLIKNLPWYKRIFVSKNIEPIFMTPKELKNMCDSIGIPRPVVYDNFFMAI